MASSALLSRSRAPRQTASPKRFGSETPRIFTPPLRKLTGRTSLGFAVIEFAETVLLLTLIPWQKWLLIHMLELRPDNLLRFRTVLVLAARQNGKSTISQVLALWFMYVYGVALVIGTAQDLDVAEEIWQGAVDLITEVDPESDEPVRPELLDLLDKVIQVNGKKALVLKTGERYKVKAANRRAGRSLSGDLILLDELREHQNWDAWAALTKTAMARAMALILALSNAGDETSVVLSYLRKMAHAALGDPDGINVVQDPVSLLPDVDDLDDYEVDDDDSLAIFEWSAPPGCAIRDRDGWAAANPSLGYTILERTIASACRTDPSWVFRTEVLCQWVVNLVEAVVAAALWAGCLDPTSQIDSVPVFALDVSPSRSWSAIAVSGMRAVDDLPHVEVTSSTVGTSLVVDHTPGTEWVVPRCVQLKERWPGFKVWIASGSAAESLVPALQAADVDVDFVKAGDVAAACGLFYDKAVGAGLRHRGQPELTKALSSARKSVEDGESAWRWGRKKSSADISALYAATLALWVLIASLNTDMDPVNNVW